MLTLTKGKLNKADFGQSRHQNKEELRKERIITS